MYHRMSHSSGTPAAVWDVRLFILSKAKNNFSGHERGSGRVHAISDVWVVSCGDISGNLELLPLVHVMDAWSDVKERISTQH